MRLDREPLDMTRSYRMGRLIMTAEDRSPARRDDDPRADDQFRASDEERHRVAELLSDHASVGRITLGEFEERVGRAYSATTRAELAELTSDLPVAVDKSGPEPRTRKATRWFVALLSGSARSGRRRLSRRVTTLSILGGDEIDLREAEIEGSELVIYAFSLMGGTNFYVPDTVEAELSGFDLLGGSDQHGRTQQPRPGSPRIRIRSFSLMGGTDVWRLPSDLRSHSPKEARRAAKQIERGR